MQTLRNASLLARLVLAWFALSIGAALASPLVNPVGMELVCTASGGAKLMVKGEGHGGKSVGHTLDCPLCAATGAPPPGGATTVAVAPAVGHAVRSIPAARMAALAAAPLPARGPPIALIA